MADRLFAAVPLYEFLDHSAVKGSGSVESIQSREIFETFRL
jgi:hypothetical protein